MKNIYLDARTAHEISERTERVISDLGYSNGPIALADVRDLLSLDLQYYASDDPGLLNEVIHRLRIGTKQVIRRPSLLLDAIRKFDLKALFVPDQKRILIDLALPELKQRWSEAHEIAHSLLPWHAEYMLGDDRTTLSPSCHDRVEAEANFGAGHILFPQNCLIEAARSAAPTISHVRDIAGHFGNTITSTLWRYIESSEDIIFGAVGEHPRYARDNEPEIAYFIRSKRFVQQFSRITEIELFQQMKAYCGYRKAGPLGEGEVLLGDDNRESHIFFCETFGNSYHVLTLARHVRRASH